MRKVKRLKKVRRVSVVKVTDLIVPKDYSLFEQGLTQSLSMSYKKCKRCFLYKINKWSSHVESYTTSFGSLVHYLLDKLYSGKFNIKKLKGIYLRRILKTLIKNYEKENAHDLVGINKQDWENEKAIAQVMMEIYCEVYRLDFIKKKFIDVEKEITFDLMTEFGKVILRMKMDGRYTNKLKEKINLEHKTAGRINELNLMKRLSYDFQNLFYMFGSTAHYKEGTDKISYNVIRKPQIRQKKTESLKEFMNRLSEDVALRPEFYFMRFEIPYTEQDLFNFRMEFQHLTECIHKDIEAAKKYQAASEVFFKNEYCCEFPYPCKFIDACSTGTMAGYKKKDKLFSELESTAY